VRIGDDGKNKQEQAVIAEVGKQKQVMMAKVSGNR
jgi:hypothetical protein